MCVKISAFGYISINDSSTFSQVQNISNDYLSKIITELLSKKRKDYKLSKYSTDSLEELLFINNFFFRINYFSFIK